MKLYFDENAGTVDSPCVLWEAYKIVMRDYIQAESGIRRKERRAAGEILDLDAMQGRDEEHEAQRRHKLALKQRELRDFEDHQARAYALASQRKLYDLGDKANRVIAWLEKRDRERRWVPELVNSEGKLCVTGADIAETFAQYYEGIYQPQMGKGLEDCLAFLKDVAMPRLTTEDAEILDSDITIEEVETAISNLQTGKAPGPNGFPAEAFRGVAGILAPRMLEMFVDAKQRGSLLRDLRSATIVVIHKSGRPQDSCGSYRPISLLNFETKVLAKILANRLSPVIKSLIHPDQSGFMPHRSTRLNLRRLYGVMHVASKHPEVPAAVVSLDAHMAFDSIEWDYLFAVLEKLGFGTVFQMWVKLLYTEPLARVAVNGTMSRQFVLRRGRGARSPRHFLHLPYSCWRLGYELIQLSGDWTQEEAGRNTYRCMLTMFCCTYIGHNILYIG